MNFLITNSVPLNGGDEALLLATIATLRARWPANSITVLCSQVRLCRRLLPDMRLYPDLERTTEDSPDPFKPLMKSLALRLFRLFGENRATSWLEHLAEGNQKQRISRLYEEADVVLSSPGGFLHDHYPIEERLRGLEVALSLGKPTILFGQSVGPFWKPESLRRVPQVMNKLTAICIRDRTSRQHLERCGVNPALIRETADVAFLWRRLAPELYRPKTGPPRRVALCFRQWPNNDTTVTRNTIANAVQLCQELLLDPKRELLFISTCQGIAGYCDDSTLALRIVSLLPPELRHRCQVNRQRYHPAPLIALLSRQDAFIGMRLHGCISALLGGTPAMGLGYEMKTPEIFGQLGMSPYQISYDRPFECWRKCATGFLNDVNSIRSGLPSALDRLCEMAEKNLAAIEAVDCAPGLDSLT